MYEYIIRGWYISTKPNGEEIEKHFSETIHADTNTEAMQMVIGKYAWLESKDGNTFRLEFIHYR